MSKAQLARFSIFFGGIVIVGTAALFLGVSTGWLAITLLSSALVFGIAAERTFNALASPEEIRRDLEDRVRNGD